MEPLNDPHGSVKLQVVTCGQFAPPSVVNDDHSADLRGLNDRLNFTAILSALATSFGK